MYPKWRHHPELEPMIVHTVDQEVSATPSEDGWRDDRDFAAAEETPKKRGRWPKKEAE